MTGEIDPVGPSVALVQAGGRRGHLKVFLGMAAGVGKTYFMLLEGQAERQAGRDVVVGLLETHGLKRALYAGDDTTDLDGFAALDGLDVSVRVAVVSTEGPSDLRARADVVVGSTDELAQLLTQL